MVLAMSVELDRLKAMLDSIKTLTFGSRSERRAALAIDQMALDLGDPTAAANPALRGERQPAARQSQRRSGAAAMPTGTWERCRLTFPALRRSSSRP